jgi:hypothetical protein
MDDEEYLQSIRTGLKESVAFFASQDKFVREKYALSEFLTNLGIEYRESELLPGGDPPDVVFRDGQFEVKEIMDKGRRRHAQYKEALARAEATTDPADLLENFSPKDLTLKEVHDLVYAVAADLTTKYPAAVRKEMDLLFYVNLQDVMGLIETPHPNVRDLEALSYRSISFVAGHRSCVFCAEPSAPDFLRSHHGVTHRVVR